MKNDGFRLKHDDFENHRIMFRNRHDHDDFRLQNEGDHVMRV